MATLVAFIASFLLAAIFGIANGSPLSALQILWLNFVIDIPIAVALGLDKPLPGLMDRKPRPANAPVLSRVQWIRLIFVGIVMAVGTLLVEALFETSSDLAVATTMGLTTFSVFHIINGLESRSESASVFSIGLADRSQLMLYGISLVAMVLATETGILNRILGTVNLDLNQWLICIGVGSTLLIVQEVMKIFIRRGERRSGEQPEEDHNVVPSPQV
jgi:Ca2+-transporting ATPase